MTSPNLKKLIFESNLTNIWKPQIGDLWSCSCSSCLNHYKTNLIETADYQAIQENLDLRNFMNFMVSSIMTSQDCGFGAFWDNRFENKDDLGFIWIPKLEQFIRLCGVLETYCDATVFYDKLNYPVDYFDTLSRLLLWIKCRNLDFESLEEALLHKMNDFLKP